MNIDTGQEEYKEKAMGCHDGERIKDAMAEANVDKRLVDTLMVLTDNYGPLGVKRALVQMFPSIANIDAESDRGEFGMPGLGVGRVRDFWDDLSEGEEPENKHAETLLLNMAPQTSLARRILRHHLPASMDLFLRRNAEYGDDNDFDLGSQGQYVDISRKVQKLKRRMWDRRGKRDGEESTRTIVMELIGHLLMTLDYMEHEDGEKSEGCTTEG